MLRISFTLAALWAFLNILVLPAHASLRGRHGFRLAERVAAVNHIPREDGVLAEAANVFAAKRDTEAVPAYELKRIVRRRAKHCAARPSSSTYVRLPLATSTTLPVRTSAARASSTRVASPPKTTHPHSSGSGGGGSGGHSGSGSGSGSGGSNSGSSAGDKSGDGTYYATGLGSCGYTNKDSDHIAAVSHLLYDKFPGYNVAAGNPNNNPICGRYATAYRNGKSVRVKIVDRCTGCALNDLDFSPSAFKQIANTDEGRVKITWSWD